MTRCILCGENAIIDHIAKAGALGSNLYDCESCGTFLIRSESNFIPDGGRNQTPAMLAAIKDGIANQRASINSVESEVVTMNIVPEYQSDADEIRAYVEKSSRFPDQVRQIGFYFTRKTKCNHCNGYHF